MLLLIAFAIYESRYEHAMMPLHIFANRARSGAYIVMAVVGAGMFGMFYFLTFFVQGVMNYSSLKAGFAFVPVSLVIIIGSGAMTQVMPRTGPKPLIAIGAGLMTVALFFFSTVDANSTYLGKILPGMLILALGMSFIFVPLTTVAVNKVQNTDAGLASALLNVGQQVGGSIGLSVLATVAATSATSSGKSHATALGATHPGSLTHYGELASSYATGKLASAAALKDTFAVDAYNAVQATRPRWASWPPPCSGRGCRRRRLHDQREEVRRGQRNAGRGTRRLTAPAARSAPDRTPAGQHSITLTARPPA